MGATYRAKAPNGRPIDRALYAANLTCQIEAFERSCNGEFYPIELGSLTTEEATIKPMLGANKHRLYLDCDGTPWHASDLTFEDEREAQTDEKDLIDRWTIAVVHERTVKGLHGWLREMRAEWAEAVRQSQTRESFAEWLKVVEEEASKGD